MKLFRSLVVALAVSAVACVPVFAQGGSAVLTGRLTDSAGLAVPGANVQVENTQTGVKYPTVTNESGMYSLSSLPPGIYTVTVDQEGFGQMVRPDVELHVADKIAIDFTLTVGRTSQSVTVDGGAPLVNTTSSSLGGLVSEHKLAELPLNGRNYTDLTLMQPGVAASPNMSRAGSTVGTWFSSNGSPVRSNNFLLDGAILQDLNNGSSASLSGTTLGLDGIREYRVITNSPSAEYGLTMGSQTVIVSKGGTDQFHGSLFEYLRNSALDAANFFDRGVAANNFQRLPPFRRNNFGGSFGGPIKKGKIFFFGTYEALRESLGVTTITNVPGAGCRGPAGAVIWNGAGAQPAQSTGPCPQLGGTTSSTVTIAPIVAPLLALYPLPNLPNNQLTFPVSQPNREDYGQVRVDQTVSDKDTLFGRYTVDDSDLITPLAYPQFTNPRLSRHQYITASETHVFSPVLLNTLRVSFSRTAGTRVSPTILSGPQYSFVPGLEIGTIAVGGLTSFGPASAAPNIQNQNIFSLSNDLYYTRGSHSLKAGFQGNGYRQYGLNSSGAKGAINFSSLSSFLQGRPDAGFNAVTPGSLIDRSYRFYTLGFYVQDDWRARPNFTLNLGLRYEPSTNTNEVHGISSSLRNLSDASFTRGPLFKNPSWKNVSPRVGFAWDVMGDGKTAVRGGFVVLYDVANLTNALLTLNSGQPPFSSRSTVSTATSFTLPFTFPAGSVGLGGNSTVQYDLKQSYVVSQNLTVERQLPFSAVIAVTYVGARGVHLISLSEGNPNIPASISPGGIPVWPATGTLVRQNPNWGNINYINSNGDSTYNALQVSLLKRLTKGLEFQSSYTWGKVIDNTQGQGPGESTSSSTFQTNPFNRRFDRGPASFSVRHTSASNALYRLPSPKFDQPVLGTLAGGWAIGGIFSVHSGLPFNPAVVAQRSRSGIAGGTTGFGGIDRPSWNPSFTGPVILGTPSRYFNPNAFQLQPVGTLGNVSRNVLEGPGFVNLDISIRKDTKLSMLGESGNLAFRAEFFNVLNHPNFAMPNNGVFAGAATDPITAAPLATAGQITSTVTASRQVQLSLRLSW